MMARQKTAALVLAAIMASTVVNAALVVTDAAVDRPGYRRWRRDGQGEGETHRRSGDQGASDQR